ncbi:alpha/beta fold hydrolase [Larsenimonas salina]|uniref:bifunctional 3-oxoadipate enol-lactonase/4-carboxymuconolactone decarboxylase PcaDC n=1 Tax=Larsenimonas salina TaxID=1295565 RepID=UPI002073346E|nr:alpha/beta fold hydrolase [Larsenimonas salina]MCM5705262.1 alpha/beta fold hydrolase [Larsenimonas salina]
MKFFEFNGRCIAYRDTGGATLKALLLGHPLGMSQAVWDELAAALAGRYRVISWDLPGHGASSPLECAITADDLAEEAVALLDALEIERFTYLGTSVGGVIGQALRRAVPDRLTALMLTNTGAVIGSPEAWQTRAERVRREGLAVMAEELSGRWFADGFVKARPAALAGWQTQLSRTDTESYARLCELLGATDFTGCTAPTDSPVFLLAGEADISTPPATLEALAGLLGGAPLAVLDGVAHVPSVEASERMTSWVRSCLSSARSQVDAHGVSYEHGLDTRSSVLGEAHVARARQGATTLDQPFQQMITRLAWGELWGNPDLAHRERSMITIAVLAALGRDGELVLHLNTAKRIGLEEAELRQALTHVAIYAGVPAANHAFKLAKEQGWGETLTAL